VLALDIGTDLLPALALGAEKPGPHTMSGPTPRGGLIDRSVVLRAFGVLGPAEAVSSMLAFFLVLHHGGWVVGGTPSAGLLAVASGTAFAAIVLGQLANAFACRSETRWVGATGVLGNRLLLMAVSVEALLLLGFLGIPVVSHLLGGSMPSLLGWLAAAGAVPVVIAADTANKAWRGRRRATTDHHLVPTPTTGGPR
jgi:magnesium-transporting ATPase (P-type)